MGTCTPKKKLSWKYKMKIRVWYKLFPPRSKPYFPRLRTFLLRLALGPATFDYMLRSIKADKRTSGAKLVDIVVRQDAREVRVEADWVKIIARIVQHIEPRKDYWYNAPYLDEPTNESLRLQKPPQKG